MTHKTYRISVVAGDGIGPEVVNETKKVLEQAGRASVSPFGFEWVHYPFGAKHYLKTQEVLPASAMEEMGRTDAMLLGAIGDPAVKPGILERGILLALRFAFDQYVNLRPSMSFERVETPVPLGAGRRIDSVVVRENTEDIYVGIGGVSPEGKLAFSSNDARGPYTFKGSYSFECEPRQPIAMQAAFASANGVARIARYAGNCARNRGESQLTIASKANAVPQLYGFFEQEAVRVLKEEFSDISVKVVNVDALCYHLVRKPDAFGVILTPNLFGDIVSDLLAALAGGLGTAAGGNIGAGLSMFEPVHGSAPDIAGTGQANPVAAILSGALLLDHLGERDAARAVERAVADYLKESDPAYLPCEFGGAALCSRVGDTVTEKLES